MSDLARDFHKLADEIERQKQAREERRLKLIRELEQQEENDVREAAGRLAELNAARRPIVGQVVETAGGLRLDDAVIAGAIRKVLQDSKFEEECRRTGEDAFPAFRKKGKPGRKKSEGGDAKAKSVAGTPKPNSKREAPTGASPTESVTPPSPLAVAAE